VQRFTPLLAEAARPCRHAVGDRWWVDETYVKVAGRWRYVYRAIDQFGQVIDVFVSPRRDATAARRFFERAIRETKTMPVEVVTDLAPVYPATLDELLPGAWHRTDRYGSNRLEADHGRLKARLRPMRGLKQDAAPGWSSPAMRSCRTFAVATMSWRSRRRRTGGWLWRSMTSPWRFELRRWSRLQPAAVWPGATAPLYGLSMDYEVFLRARMREEYDASGSTGTAVVQGLGRVGQLVTSAR
jgi:transposase-like protein